VRATFTCKACGFDVPLNHFELDDGVVCTRCGVEQRYDASGWRELIQHAHAVADFGAPGAEGRSSDPEYPIYGAKPFAEIGARASWAASGSFQASPGNPLCRACKGPLVVTARRGRVLEVACSRCSERHAYELPAKIHTQGLAGVLADEHEEGRRDAAVATESGMAMLRCPNCSAPLENVKDADGVFTCTFCKAACRISAHVHARAGHKGTPVKTWWLYFEHASHMRRDLVGRAKQREAAQASAQRAQAKRLERERAEREEREAERRRRELAKAEREAGVERQANRAEKKAMIPLLLVVATMPIFFALFFWGEHKKQTAKAAEADAKLGDPARLADVSFEHTAEENAALFGKLAVAGQPIALRQPAVFKRVTIEASGRDIHLEGSPTFDPQRAIARLRTIAPHTIDIGANGEAEISVNQTRIQIDSRRMPQYNGHVDVGTTISDSRAGRTADAFYAAVRYAALDGPALGPDQLRILNGWPLAEAAKLDPATPVEGAAKAVQAVFPYAECRTTTDLLTRLTKLACVADVDSAAVAQLRLDWPSAAGAHLGHVTFALRATARAAKKVAVDPTDCLTKALGPGTKKVVDFASGRSETSWPLGKHGDRAVLGPVTVEIETAAGAPATAATKPRGGAPATKAPDWTKSYSAVVSALAGCER
jgi:hypothetical protein